MRRTVELDPHATWFAEVRIWEDAVCGATWEMSGGDLFASASASNAARETWKVKMHATQVIADSLDRSTPMKGS